MSKIYCPKCGNVVQVTDHFCRKCGSPITTKNINLETEKPVGINQPNQGKVIKRIIGFFILSLCFANIALSFVPLVIFGERPYIPGDIAKINPSTASLVFWGEFYTSGNGRIEFLNEVPTELAYANWIVVARDLPFGRKDVIVRSNKKASEKPALMNANIYIPEVAVSDRTSLQIRVVINGYVARPIGNNNFVYDLVEMKSEPITLQIVPTQMRWLIRQSTWLPFSFIVGWLAFFVLIK